MYVLRENNVEAASNAKQMSQVLNKNTHFFMRYDCQV